MWNFGLYNFVASVNKTAPFDIAIAQVVLSSNNVSKNSRTKRALVGNHQSVHMVSKLMPRQFGFDFMVGKLAQTVALVTAFNSRSNKMSHSTI